MRRPISRLTGKRLVLSTYVVVPASFKLHAATAKAMGVVAETPLGKTEKVLELPAGKVLTPTLQAFVKRTPKLEELRAELAKTTPKDPVPPEVEPVEEPKELDGKTLK